MNNIITATSVGALVLDIEYAPSNAFIIIHKTAVWIFLAELFGGEITVLLYIPNTTFKVKTGFINYLFVDQITKMHL